MTSTHISPTHPCGSLHTQALHSHSRAPKCGWRNSRVEMAWFNSHMPSFLWLNTYYSSVWTKHILFIHSSIDGHLNCFPFWLYGWYCCKDLCGHMISFILSIYQEVELLGRRYPYLTFWGYCQVVFRRSCTILHFYKQCMRLPISLHPHQYLLLSFFCILAIFESVN